MVRKAIIFFYLAVSLGKITGQCTISGGMSVYLPCDNGTGCLSGCNLTAYNWFGPMCNGTAVSGNCSTGSKNVSTQYQIPAGCTATVTAEFKNRTGCSASGIDVGDNLSITSSGGVIVSESGAYSGAGCTPSSTTFPTASIPSGCGNADGIVTMIVTGGSVTVNLGANRSDEIATFSVTLSGAGSCICSSILPLKLISFWGEPNEKNIQLYWLTYREDNVAYYLIEKSSDGITFFESAKITALYNQQNQQQLYSYSDIAPLPGINYYRIKNIDNDGKSETHPVLSVNYIYKMLPIHIEQNEAYLKIHINTSQGLQLIELIDLTGRVVKQLISDKAGCLFVDKTGLNKGMYLIRNSLGLKIVDSKIIIY